MDLCDNIKMEFVAEDWSIEDENAKTPTPKKKRHPKPKVSAIWTKNDGHALIQAVQQHSCLWQYNSADYKLLTKRDSAWRAIEQDLGGRFSVEECKAKWANIKTAYLKVKGKFLETKSSLESNVLQPQWAFWTDMQFYHKNEMYDNTASTSSQDLADFDAEANETSQSAFINKQRLDEKSNLQPQEALNRALQFLDADSEDEWDIIGRYLASQLRYVATNNDKLARSLHLKLIQATMATLTELNDND